MLKAKPPVYRRGGGGFQETHAELPPVRPLVDPFAGRNHRGVAHRGDEIAVGAGLDTEHAEAGLGVVEGDPLDEAGQVPRGQVRRLVRRLGRRECGRSGQRTGSGRGSWA